MRTCKDCGVSVKPRHQRCPSCQTKWEKIRRARTSKEYRRNNLDYLKEANRRWNLENRDSVNARRAKQRKALQENDPAAARALKDAANERRRAARAAAYARPPTLTESRLEDKVVVHIDDEGKPVALAMPLKEAKRKAAKAPWAAWDQLVRQRREMGNPAPQ